VSTVPGEATGAALIVVDAGGNNQIAVGAGASAALATDDVRRGLEGVLDRAGCLLVSLEIPHEAVRAADGGDEAGVGAEPSRGHRRVAALSAAIALEAAAQHRLAPPRQPLGGRDQVDVDRPDDDHDGGETVHNCNAAH
jgi:hypothetical protein